MIARILYTICKEWSDRVLKIEDKDCTGCETCASVCAKAAISFIERNGFRYPAVDNDKCVSCGLCVKKCPSLNFKKNDDGRDEVKVYAAWTMNQEQRANSTSGGICYELSRMVLGRGGYVAGVEWTDGFKNARYSLIDSIEDIRLISQSKYFQPQMNDIYTKVKEKLEQGKEVLFIGTACTNDGLSKFLNKDYELLTYCDFVCRGYTSQIYHAKRIDYLETKYNSRISYVQYKNKDKGWNSFGTKFMFENGKELYCNRADDPYEIMFQIDDFNTRPSCFNCNYRCLPRKADITVGDFWGIEGIEPENLKNGISVVILSSEKGERIFDEVKGRVHFEKRTVNEVSKGNYALLNQLSMPKMPAKVFFEDLDRMNMEEFEKKYASKRIIRTKKIKSLLGHLRQCDLLKFIKYNFLCKEIERKRLRFIFPYKGSCIDIKKGAVVQVNDNLVLNSPKHLRSKEQSFLMVLSGGSLKINGFTNLAAGAVIEVHSGAELSLGKVETNYGTTIICSNCITIGNGVAIGRNVMVYDSNYHPTSFNKNIKLKPLIIEDHVWLCSGVTVAKGLRIGEGAICGLNSMITRNVKPKTLVMGNPAKVIMANVEW